mmetsp:Transcript_34508/g.73201  ORF Transcript_34508/g.73201 Transcript_34508/m.73201 type:complete len:403 (-) Transcript_34508:188-1396(-)
MLVLGLSVTAKPPPSSAQYSGFNHGVSTGASGPGVPSSSDPKQAHISSASGTSARWAAGPPSAGATPSLSDHSRWITLSTSFDVESLNGSFPASWEACHLAGTSASPGGPTTRTPLAMPVSESPPCRNSLTTTLAPSSLSTMFFTATACFSADPRQKTTTWGFRSRILRSNASTPVRTVAPLSPLKSTATAPAPSFTKSTGSITLKKVVGIPKYSTNADAACGHGSAATTSMSGRYFRKKHSTLPPPAPARTTGRLASAKRVTRPATVVWSQLSTFSPLVSCKATSSITGSISSIPRHGPMCSCRRAPCWPSKATSSTARSPLPPRWPDLTKCRTCKGHLADPSSRTSFGVSSRMRSNRASRSQATLSPRDGGTLCITLLSALTKATSFFSSLFSSHPALCR